MLNLGRTLFELREYQKCAHVLEKIKEQSQSALFLRNYAVYLVCEQVGEEQILENGDKISAMAHGANRAGVATSSYQKELNGV